MAASLVDGVESMTLCDDDECAEKFALGKVNDYLNLSLKLGGEKEEITQFYKERLNYILQVAEAERNDTSFARECVLCKDFFRNRSAIFDHLRNSHNLFVGYPEDIVFGTELIDILKHRIDNNECLYCEKTFHNWPVLKTHMRKKRHKRINPKDIKYDKYYIANYLEPGQTWRDYMKEGYDSEEFADFYDNIEEFEEEMEEPVLYKCLFCSSAFEKIQGCYDHMLEVHSFDFKYHVASQQLDFYSQVKLVNFYRHSRCKRICPNCSNCFPDSDVYLAHCKDSGHSKEFPNRELWDQTMFLFPILEDDHFLCSLDDEINDGTDDPVIIPEDINPPTLIPCLTWEEIIQMQS